MTDLGYLHDAPSAYQRSFEATVVSLPPGGVVLDRTFFYPTGGGQPHDTGNLRGPGGATYRVVDVTKSGPSVVHRIERDGGSSGVGLQLGDRVTGEIDWDRRSRFMRMHSAQHLVSALAFERVGLRTHRAELKDDHATIDLERPWPPSQAWERFTAAVAETLAHPPAVEIRFVSRGEWDHAPAGRSALVPLPPQVDPVRVVRIVGVDECPCGGTHVRSMSEVGVVSFSGPPSPRGVGCRLRFTIDERALTTSHG